jgi:FkbM family methyltransferase
MFEEIRLLTRAWKYRRRNEPAEIAYLLRHLKPGDVAIDVGAHKGAYLYWMRKRVGPEGRVIAFEPQPRLAHLLRNVVSRKVWTNVTIEDAGVSSHSGAGRLHVPQSAYSETSPSARLSSDPITAAGTDLAIDLVTLDDYFTRNAIQRIDFLKCDVEGHELDVFRGAAGLLQTFHPRLLFECESRHHPRGSIRPVFQYLEQFGYVGRFFHRQELLPLSRFDCARHQVNEGERFWEHPDYSSNFVFEAGSPSSQTPRMPSPRVA